MQRVIFLVDMNSFFISCESTRNPSITGKPAAVAGDPKKRTGIILTANYEARKFGVKTTMVVHEALKLCPQLILIPPDHNFYEQKSREVMEILSCHTPVIEQNSIDEAWLDMTGCEGIFGKPAASAKMIMDRIRNELGLWCSIGISENKFLSKMASEMKKPLGITELWKEDIKFKMWPLPVQAMYGIGKQTAQKLQSMGISTIGELAHYNSAQLVKKLGKSGAEMHQLANGIDISAVSPHSDNDIKSIGRSITLSEDITDFEQAKIILLELADEVGMTARKYEKKGRTVHINMKYSNFQVITRQTTVPATYLVKEIYSAGIDLLRKNWNEKLPVRLLGISLSGFAGQSTTEQISMFQMPELNRQEGNMRKDGLSKNDEVKTDRLESTIDVLRKKYGNTIINRGALMKKKNKE
jgi:DNA polymerase-4